MASGFTEDIVKDFIIKNGCKVTNHELVTKFKTFLNDPDYKGQPENYCVIQGKEEIDCSTGTSTQFKFMTCLLLFFTIITYTYRYLRTGYMGYPYGAHTEERLTLE